MNVAAMRQFNKTETTVHLWLSPLTREVGKNPLNTANVLQAPHTEQSCIHLGGTQGVSIGKERETSTFSRLFTRLASEKYRALLFSEGEEDLSPLQMRVVIFHFISDA